MILIDYSQIAISNLMMELSNKNSEEPNEDLVRHMIFNALRAFNHKFKNTYGEIIICIDGSDYWRKAEFPPYKANRKKAQANSKFDWDLIQKCLSVIRTEVVQYMPFKSIWVQKAEADDIIAVLTKYREDPLEQVLIISGDEDYIQLQSIPGVQQYSPTQKKMIKHPYPSHHLKELIIRGDTGDGIPNFLSPDKSFTDKIRQKSIYQKDVDVWIHKDFNEFCDTPEKKERYKRNQKLVDFDYIPDQIRDSILLAHAVAEKKPLSVLFNHCINKRMAILLESIQEFA